MKGIKHIVYLMVLFCFVNSSWALKTKFDPTIYENELKLAGISHIAKVQSDLGLERNNHNKPQALVVKHVITTGRNSADRNYVLIDIDTLEKISPAPTLVRSLKPVALNDEQVNSILSSRSLANHEEKWLRDKQSKKYINIVLQKQNTTDAKISPISYQEAKSLIKWAIKNKRLDKEDHPIKLIEKH